jgi:hypothetical protein
MAGKGQIGNSRELIERENHELSARLRQAIKKAEFLEQEKTDLLEVSKMADDELNEFVALARYFIKWLPDLADHFHNLGMAGAEVEVGILAGKAKMLLKKYKHPPLEIDRHL